MLGHVAFAAAAGVPRYVFADPTIWEGELADYTLSGADAFCTTSDKHIRSTFTFDGDFELIFTAETASSVSALFFGIYPSSEDPSWSSTDSAGSNRGITGAYLLYINSGGNIYLSGSSVDTFTHAAGDIYRIVREGTTVTFYQDETSLHSTMISGSVRMTMGQYGADDNDIDNIHWLE